MTDDLKRAMEALECVRDYFDQRADADAVGDPMRYQGNAEMHRLRDCDVVLAALREREQAIEQAYWRGSSEALVDTPWGSVDGVHKAIEQARKDEREACANVAAEFSPPDGYDDATIAGRAAMQAGDDIAAAIRARGAR